MGCGGSKPAADVVKEAEERRKLEQKEAEPRRKRLAAEVIEKMARGELEGEISANSTTGVVGELDGEWHYVRSAGRWTGTSCWGESTTFEGMRATYTGGGWYELDAYDQEKRMWRGVDGHANGWRSEIEVRVVDNGQLYILSKHGTGKSEGLYRRGGGAAGGDGGGGGGWFRIIPQHRPEGHAVCWTSHDADPGKLKVSAHDVRVHHGGQTNEATKIQIGPDDTDASLWRKVDVQVRPIGYDRYPYRYSSYFRPTRSACVCAFLTSSDSSLPASLPTRAQGEWFRLESKMCPGSTLNTIHAEHRDARFTLWHDKHENSLYKLENSQAGAFTRIVPKHAQECALTVYAAGGHGTDICLWDDRPTHGHFQFVAASGERYEKKAESGGPSPTGEWLHYKNIDMCFQGDAQIIGDWQRTHTVESLKKIVEEKGYSAVCVGSFGHAALKSFDYQLTKEHCAPSLGYTNDLYIWVPDASHAKPAKDQPVGGGGEEAGGEKVTVSMGADDYIDEVFYNGQSLRHLVSKAASGANEVKTFSFEAVPGAVLAIAANDNQPGTSAAFFLKCTSSDPSSGWHNLQLRPNHPNCKSFGTAHYGGNVGSMGRPKEHDPPRGWETNGFDDSQWKPPTAETHTHCKHARPQTLDLRLLLRLRALSHILKPL